MELRNLHICWIGLSNWKSSLNGFPKLFPLSRRIRRFVAKFSANTSKLNNKSIINNNNNKNKQ